MQVSVAKKEPCQAHVSFQVPQAEFDAEFQRALREVGKKARFKGFRPGHVPPAVVERFQGEQVRFEVAQRFLQQAYERAVKENELKPLAHPRIDIGKVEPGADFAREFEVNLRPEFTLGDYKGLEVESALQPVMDEEVEAAIEQARKQQAHPEAVGDDGLPDDGMALARVELVHNDAIVFERDGLRISPSSPLPGIEPNAYKQILRGARDGTQVEIAMTFPGDFENEAARNQEGKARIHVKQAFKVIVPTREELMKVLGAESEEALKKLARDKMEEANEQQEQARIETELLERVIGAHDMQLPPNMVEEQTKARLAQMKAELVQRGTAEAQAEEEVSAREAEARTAAEKSSRAYFLVERIAEKEGLKVTENDLIGDLRVIARRNKASLEEVRDYYKEQNLFPQLAMEILERKVRAFLRTNAAIKAPNV